MSDQIERQAAIDANTRAVRGCGEQKCYHQELKRTVKRMTGKNDGLEKRGLSE